MDWSTINIRAWPDPQLPFVFLKPLFRRPTSASKFDSFPNPQNPPNQAQNASKTLPQTLPKRIQNSISSYNARNPKNMQPFHTKTSFLTFPDPQKSSQNRCQDTLKISFNLGYPLETPKNTIFDVKTSPRWTPKISDFFKNRSKMLAITVFGPRCLFEGSKSLPRASREPPKSCSRALKKHPSSFKTLPAASQAPSQRRPRALKRHLSPDMGASWAQGARCQVSGVRC